MAGLLTGILILLYYWYFSPKYRYRITGIYLLSVCPTFNLLALSVYGVLNWDLNGLIDCTIPGILKFCLTPDPGVSGTF